MLVLLVLLVLSVSVDAGLNCTSVSLLFEYGFLRSCSFSRVMRVIHRSATLFEAAEGCSRRPFYPGLRLPRFVVRWNRSLGYLNEELVVHRVQQCGV